MSGLGIITPPWEWGDMDSWENVHVALSPERETQDRIWGLFSSRDFQDEGGGGNRH